MKKSMDDIFYYADCSWSKRSSLQEKNKRKSSIVVERRSRGRLPSSTPYSTCSSQINRVTPAEEIELVGVLTGLASCTPSSSSATLSSSSSSAVTSITPRNLSLSHASVTNCTTLKNRPPAPIIDRAFYQTDASTVFFNDFPKDRKPFQVDNSNIFSMFRSTVCSVACDEDSTFNSSSVLDSTDTNSMKENENECRLSAKAQFLIKSNGNMRKVNNKTKYVAVDEEANQVYMYMHTCIYIYIYICIYICI
jgi:hypothetical protein